MFSISFVVYTPFSFQMLHLKKSHVKLLYGKDMPIKYFLWKNKKEKQDGKREEKREEREGGRWGILSSVVIVIVQKPHKIYS